MTMTQMNEETQFIIAQFFMVNPASEAPRIHPRKKELPKGKLLKMIDQFILDIESYKLDINPTPYQVAASFLRKMKDKNEYEVLKSELFLAYASTREKRQNSVPNFKKTEITSAVNIDKLRAERTSNLSEAQPIDEQDSSEISTEILSVFEKAKAKIFKAKRNKNED
jgi:hypothetical protein